ncbi:hypothetical protein H4R18_004301 [Coemansia javaensis]|uniref:glucan 1,4-alpha-glucosidase n=1 Tax=Coemansia javaensis TaxID=2761396 RepID=A0A9W8H9E7_9FUNG|nr:hypothetical protein H4R18_004301 [Coemansia javaensis]
MAVTATTFHALLVLAAAVLPAAAAAALDIGRQRPFEGARSTVGEWALQQDAHAQRRILANIAPFSGDGGAMPGAVCASPSRAHPDYYYAWTRDAALVMREVLEWAAASNGNNNSTDEAALRERMDSYVAFTRHVQRAGGLGDAKFHMDGAPFRGPWCNPQHDGPAIRARTMMAYMRLLAARSNATAADADADASGAVYRVVVRDLDHVADAWPCAGGCDIWEEVRGRHFYTLLAQQRALAEGARVAAAAGDAPRARRFRDAAAAIAPELRRFWDAGRGYIVATVDRSDGPPAKRSGLDAQVLLAVLHHAPDMVGAAHVTDTVLSLVRAFEPMYAVNRAVRAEVGGRSVPVGVAVGRYPEDVYDGDGSSAGNPWSLATSAVAEYHYRLALRLVSAATRDNDALLMPASLARLVAWTRGFHGHDKASTDLLLGLPPPSPGAPVRGAALRGLLHYLLASGDLYMARVAYHTGRDRTMHEQWSRASGYGRGAIHLTWSYAAHMSASRARAMLVRELERMT